MKIKSILLALVLGLVISCDDDETGVLDQMAPQITNGIDTSYTLYLKDTLRIKPELSYAENEQLNYLWTVDDQEVSRLAKLSYVAQDTGLFNFQFSVSSANLETSFPFSVKVIDTTKRHEPIVLSGIFRNLDKTYSVGQDEDLLMDALYLEEAKNVKYTITWKLDDKLVSNEDELNIKHSQAGVYSYTVEFKSDAYNETHKFTVNVAPAPKLSIQTPENAVYKLGTKYIFEAKFQNKKSNNASYRWLLNNQEVGNSAQVELSLEKRINKLSLEVKNDGYHLKDSVLIDEYEVNFDAIDLKTENSYWWGKGGNYYQSFNVADCYDELVIDSTIKISNLNFLDMHTKVGFATSNYKASTVKEDKYPGNQLDIQYAAYPATGIDKYLVMYKAPVSFGPTWNPDSLVMVEPILLSSMTLTNNAYAYCSMKYGDAVARKFTNSDWFKLVITGWDEAGNETGKVDFMLAENGEILDTWKNVSLESLGKVKKLTFKMESTDVKANNGWVNTPLYFCIGGINYKLQ